MIIISKNIILREKVILHKLFHYIRIRNEKLAKFLFPRRWKKWDDAIRESIIIMNSI